MLSYGVGVSWAWTARRRDGEAARRSTANAVPMAPPTVASQVRRSQKCFSAVISDGWMRGMTKRDIGPRGMDEGVPCSPEEDTQHPSLKFPTAYLRGPIPGLLGAWPADPPGT